jgi:hypothetical protein
MYPNARIVSWRIPGKSFLQAIVGSGLWVSRILKEHFDADGEDE